MNKRITTYILSTVFGFCATVAVAQVQSQGQLEYQSSCAICHGPEGKGGGTFDAFLEGGVPDLTQLSKGNGGKFPLNRVYSIIDGREDIAAHGERFMTVWGSRYNAEMVQKLDAFGPADTETVERLVRGRILELVFFLQSIQE